MGKMLIAMFFIVVKSENDLNASNRRLLMKVIVPLVME